MIDCKITCNIQYKYFRKRSKVYFKLLEGLGIQGIWKKSEFKHDISSVKRWEDWEIQSIYWIYDTNLCDGSNIKMGGLLVFGRVCT